MIYTNIDNLNIKVKTSLYTKLGDNFKNWIEKNTIKLYIGRTKSEDLTSEILKKLNVNFEPQCFFFDSSNKKCYFLDFLLLDKNIALEVDGGYHKLNKEYDKDRDRFFKTIGIKTVRINNKDVSYDTIKNKILNIKHKSFDNNKQIKDAMKINDLIKRYNTKYKTNADFINII